MFGLRIQHRLDPRVHHLFEFDTEGKISLVELCEMMDVSLEVLGKWDSQEWNSFLQNNALIKLDLDESKETWTEKAKELLGAMSE